MPDVIINLPPLPVQLLPSVSAFAALRALPSMSLISGQDYAVDGSATFGDGGGGLFVWNPSSMQADDNARIIRPNDLTSLQAGRWLLGGGKQLADAIGEVEADTTLAIAEFADQITFLPNGYYSALTAVAAAALTVPDNFQALSTLGYSTAGDGGAAYYRRVAGQPSHPGYIRDVSGAYFEIAMPIVPVEALGATAAYISPGNTGPTNQTTIGNALKVLVAKAAMGISFRPGKSYWCGDYTGQPQNSIFGPSVTDGLSGLIQGNGAKLIVRSGAVSVSRDLFLMQAVGGLTFDNLKALDLTGHNNSDTDPHGLRPFTLYGGGGYLTGTACTGITFRDIDTEGCLGMVSVLNADITSPLRVSGVRLEGYNVARNCYYGLNCQEDGDDISGSYTTFNARRAWFAYGCRGHNLEIQVSHDGAASGSDGTIKLVRYSRDTFSHKLRVRFSGSVVQTRPLSIGHLNNDGASSLIDDTEIDLFFPPNVAACDNLPAVTFFAKNAAGTDLTTPLNTDGASAPYISPVTTLQRYGNWKITINGTAFGALPLVFSAIVPLDPGSGLLYVPDTLGDDRIDVQGFLVNGKYIGKVTGDADGQTLTIPLYAYRNNRVALDVEYYGQSAKTGSGPQHLERIAYHGIVASDGATTAIGTAVPIYDASASTGSDLTFTANWGYGDRLILMLNSAADYTASTAYVKSNARVIYKESL